MTYTRVCIIGAGPAGAAAALQLNKLGIDCIIVDKAIFPRDKICGDGLSGKVISALKRIDPIIAGRLQQEEQKLNSWGVRFYAPNRQQMDVGFSPEFEKAIANEKQAPIGYVYKREGFDHFLVKEIKACRHVQLFEGIKIEKYTLLPDGYEITGSNGFKVKAAMIINAAGAHSAFTKQVAGIQMEPRHFMAGVRGYFNNVQGMSDHHFIELHFLQHLTPGYFWIFPLPDGQANVGVCMLSSDVRRRKMNLKKELMTIIEKDSLMKERFKTALLTGMIEGYGLPLGSKKRKISGERYLLAGDAAYLIDPLTGEGIGNALTSGRIAALQAEKAIQSGDFSSAALESYDREINRVMGKELMLSRRLQKLARFTWLFNTFFEIGVRNKSVKSLVSSMFYEIDVRKQLTQPSFYFKLLFNK